MFAGSHYKNSKDLTNWIASETLPDGSPAYDVTALVFNDDSKIKEADNLHVIRHPDDYPIDDKLLSTMRDPDDMVPYLMALPKLVQAILLEYKESIFDKLNEEDFHVHVGDCTLTDKGLGAALNIPGMYQCYYLPENTKYMFGGHVSQLAYSYPDGVGANPTLGYGYVDTIQARISSIAFM
jgi:hypothetical protein